MEALALISASKDIVLGLSAATTAAAAVIGLRRWQKELHGKAEFDTARALIRYTYQLRDALRDLRAPFISAGEFPNGYQGHMSPASPQDEAEAWSHVYRNRWRPVQDAMQGFEASVLEAEALWGGEIRAKADEMRNCVQQLYVAIETVVADKAAGGKNFESDKQFGKEMRAMVSASSKATDNMLSDQIDRAVDGIERKLAPHLRRR